MACITQAFLNNRGGRKFWSWNLMAMSFQAGVFKWLGSVIGENAFVRRHGCKFPFINELNPLDSDQKAWLLHYITPQTSSLQAPCPHRREERIPRTTSMLVSANKKVCLVARNLLAQDHPVGHQGWPTKLSMEVGVLVPRPSCSEGGGHGISLALPQRHRYVFFFRYFSSKS